jgi:uncharacterized membrane protein
MLRLHTPANSILPILFDYLGIKYNYGYLKDRIQLEPDADSLAGIGNLLNEYNVDNLCFKISSEDLLKVDFPCITQLIQENDNIVVVTKIEDDRISYISKSGLEKTFTLIEFVKLWTGVVLLIETNNKSGEKNYHLNKKTDLIQTARVPFIALSSLFILLYCFWQNITTRMHPLTSVAIFGLATIGLLITILLITQTVDKQNPFTEKICKLVPGHKCETILEGSASAILGISWSQIGFVFFLGYLLNMAMVPDALYPMALVTIAALPFTIWSIFYMLRVAKNLCILCLATQLTIWAIFITHLFGKTLSLGIGNYKQPLGSLLCFTFPITLLNLFLPVIRRAQLVSPLVRKVRKILSDHDIFEMSLNHQKQFIIDDPINKIVFGNPAAPFVISIVTNPFCAPCGKVHAQLEDLLSTYRDEICVRIIFAPGKEHDNEQNSAITHLVASYFDYGVERSEIIFSHWYQKGKDSFKAFSELYPVVVDEEKYNAILQSYRDWCLTQDIQFTPTVIVNNFKIPAWYGIEDLKYFIRT